MIFSVGIYLLSFVLTWLAGMKDGDGYTNLLSKLIAYTFRSGRVFAGIGYFGVGMLFAKNKWRPSKILCAIVLAAGLAYSPFAVLTRVNITGTPYLILMAGAVFVFAEMFQGDEVKSGYLFARGMSTVIYFTHMIFLFFGGLLFFGFEEGAKGIVPFLRTVGCAVVFALIVARFFWKSKVAKVLFK